MVLYLRLLIATARSAFRSRHDLVFENLTLRYQLTVLARPSRLDYGSSTSPRQDEE